MDPAAAALIGAGAGAGVSLAGQFLGHDLSIRRDRRTEERDRLWGVVTRAAQALYIYAADYGVKSTEPTQRDKDLDPSLAEQYRVLDALVERTRIAEVELRVHLGHDHPLFLDYIGAESDCRSAQLEAVRHAEQSKGQEKAGKAELEREQKQARAASADWMDAARRYLNEI